MIKSTLTRSILGGMLLACPLLTQISCSDDQETMEALEKEVAAAPARSGLAAVQSSSFDAQLALRWAPIHLQDTDVTGTYSLSGKSDYISAIDFDGDWNATNNWKNTANYSLPAYAYYSVVETSTHWFVIYAFFHPRDWTDISFLYHADQHENDLEGLLAVVQKNGTAYGNLQAMVTVSHSDFYSFLPSGSHFQANEEGVDGSLSFETINGEPHPLTAQEAKGHGLKAFPYYNINGDGVKYYPSPSFSAEAPQHANDRYVPYKLVNIFESNGLWDQRYNTSLFASAAGSFKSSVGSGGANAPWAWDDKDDTPGRGALATDPARLVSLYFRNLGNFDQKYVRNRYLGIN